MALMCKVFSKEKMCWVVAPLYRLKWKWILSTRGYIFCCSAQSTEAAGRSSRMAAIVSSGMKLLPNGLDGASVQSSLEVEGTQVQCATASHSRSPRHGSERVRETRVRVAATRSRHRAETGPAGRVYEARPDQSFDRPFPRSNK